MNEAGNLEYVKKFNRIGVLNVIRERKTIFRQELVKLTGLTPAAISAIVRELVEKGYVKEIGLGKSIGGRRPVKFQFQSEAGYVIGAEITRERTTLGIVNLEATPIILKEVPINMTDPWEGIRSLIKEIDSLIECSRFPVERVLCAGFAFPGLLDVRTKNIKRSENLGEKWCNVPVKELLESQMQFPQMPVFIEHNSNAAALAEQTIGLGKGIKDLVYVNMGEGFSAGVVADGKILYGCHGYAGEIGHMVIMEDGPLCNCGNRGCLESICSVPALVRRANNELSLYRKEEHLKSIWSEKGSVTIFDILECATEVDSYAWKLIRQAGSFIGIGVANLINFFNPEVVSLGGILAGAGSVMMEPLLDSICTHAFPEIAQMTRIELSTLGRHSGFYGISLGAINSLFDLENAGILYGTEQL